MKQGILRNRFLTIALCLLLTLVSVGSASAAEFVYVINDSAAGNNIYGYQVNSTTGALTAISGSPFATGGTGNGITVSQRITIDRVNRRLYAINDGSDTVSAYSINITTGALTALPFSPIALGAGTWFSIAVHPSGSPLIVGDTVNRVRSYNITAATAIQAAGSPYTTGTAAPYSSIFSRNGNFFYTGADSGTAFAGFSVNAATGVLTALAGSPFNSGANFPYGYATDTQGRFFAVNFSVNQVRAFTTAAGVPTAVAGNPFTSGLTSAVDGALSPNENFYAAADRSGNRIGVYQISGTGSATTLAPVAGSPFASGGAFTDALVFNLTNTFLFAANGNSRNITKWNFNSATGVLTAQVVQPANTAGAAGLLTGIAYINTTAPTAANVSVSGRVFVGKSGLTNAIVTLTDSNGQTRTARTTSFGYYHFDDITAGQTIVLTVTSKRYQFAPQVVNVQENLTDLDFYASSGESFGR